MTISLTIRSTAVFAAFACCAGPVVADGKDVYGKTCAVCHATGVGGAPKFANKGDWQARLAGGKDALVASVVKGKGAMPAKGGNPSLSDGDVKAAVDFMLDAVK